MTKICEHIGGTGLKFNAKMGGWTSYVTIECNNFACQIKNEREKNNV